MGDRLAIRADPFRLPVPDGWADRTVVTLTGPDDGGFAPNIVLTAEPLCDHMGLGAFASGWLSRLAEHVSVREIRAVEHTHVAAEAAQVRTIGWADAGVGIAQLAALVLHDEVGYAIVATGLEETLDELDAVFRDVLEGFSFADREEPG